MQGQMSRFAILCSFCHFLPGTDVETKEISIVFNISRLSSDEGTSFKNYDF